MKKGTKGFGRSAASHGKSMAYPSELSLSLILKRKKRCLEVLQVGAISRRQVQEARSSITFICIRNLRNISALRIIKRASKQARSQPKVRRSQPARLSKGRCR